MRLAILARATCMALVAPVAVVACGGRLEGLAGPDTDSGNAPTADAGGYPPADASDADVVIDAPDENADASDEDADVLPAPPLSTTCPAPTDIAGGESCMGIVSGLTCRGNPTTCNGATFYDALQCDGAAWMTLASTICGIDGG